MSGLRDELAALADEWDASSTWDQETPCEDSDDCARCCARDLRALLDRFPPEAATVQDLLRSEANRRGERGYVHYATVRNDMRKLADHMDVMSEFGSGPPEAAHPALAASPEEQDR